MTLFFNKTIHKSNLDLSIEWNQPLNEKIINQITAVHVEAFLDVYQQVTEKKLGLAAGVTKKDWLAAMIADELAEIKTKAIPYACGYIDDQLIGFIICDPVKPRYDAKTAKQNHWFKNDVYIRMLAVKPIKGLVNPTGVKNVIDNHCRGPLPANIKIGLGRLLIESIDKQCPDANTITLDTRLVNLNARAFYEHLGFCFEKSITLGGSDPNHYVGYEKQLTQRLGS